MALTESNMLELGSTCPTFSLPNIDGTTISSTDMTGKPLLVMFICNHCPYVKHVAPELARLGKDYNDREIEIVAIQSNDIVEYPDDGPEKMKAESAERGYTFPYLLDETQEVAKAFKAACTPDFFLFDGQHKLVYRGQIDSTRLTRIESGVYDSPEPPNGKDLRAAIDTVLSGQTPSPNGQVPSVGCNIKWKPTS